MSEDKEQAILQMDLAALEHHDPEASERLWKALSREKEKVRVAREALEKIDRLPSFGTPWCTGIAHQALEQMG